MSPEPIWPVHFRGEGQLGASFTGPASAGVDDEPSSEAVNDERMSSSVIQYLRWEVPDTLLGHAALTVGGSWVVDDLLEVKDVAQGGLLALLPAFGAGRVPWCDAY